MGCVGLATYMGNRNAHRSLVGKYEKNYHFEDLGLDGRIILKCILMK